MAIALIALSVPGATHENHEQLGAGPGPAATTENAAKADAVTLSHENMAGAHAVAAEHHEAAAEESKTFAERLISWLGRLHTLAVHFPVAMFVGALGVELFGLWRRDREYRRVAHIMLVVGSLGALVAALLGWFAGGFYLSDRNPVLMIHRWLGTAIAVAAFALLYLSAAARGAPEKPRTIYWILLALMTVAISIQGYFGGTFMHGGMNHLAF